MRSILLLPFLLLVYSSSYGQQNISQTTSAGVDVDGTYFFVQNSKSLDVFTMSLFDEIENRRLQSVREEWEYSETTTIVILSRDEINQPGFTPVNTDAPWEE